MLNPTPMLRDNWPNNGDRPGVVPAPARLGLDDVLYDELDTPLDFYVKTYPASDDLPLDFIDQAAVQWQLTKAGARHWIPVREARKANGCFQVVLPFLPVSVQKLISEHAALSSQQLIGILRGIVAGLVEIRRHHKRPHGNLKPTNVLLRSRRLNADAVALTDPAPTQRALERGESGDLRRLGELVHLLILHRLPRGNADWPVQSSPAWQRLGRRGELLRNLCSAMIDPRGPALVLDDLARILRRASGKGRFLKTTALLGMSAAAVIAGIFVYQHPSTAWRHPSPALAVARQPSPPQTPLLSVVENPVTPNSVRPSTPIKPAPPVAAARAFDPAMARQFIRNLSSQAASLASASSTRAMLLWADYQNRRREALTERFLADCARPPAAVVPEIVTAITAQDRQLADRVRHDHSLLTPSLIAQRDRSRQRYLQADAILKDFPDHPLPTPYTPLGQRAAKPLAEMNQRLRQTTISGAIEMCRSPLEDQQLSARLKSLVGDATALRARAAQRLAEIDQLVRRLSDGYLPDSSPDAVPLQSAIATWAASRQPEDAPFKEVFDVLLESTSLSDPKLFRQSASSSDVMLGLRFAAWISPKYPVPAMQSELAQDTSSRDALLEAANLHRGRITSTSITAAFDRRWIEFLAHPHAAEDVAFALDPHVKPATVDLTKLTGSAQWNAQWFELRRLAHDPRALPRIHDVIASLIHTADALPAGSVPPQLLKDLQQWNDLPFDEDLSHLGPASPLATVRWLAQPEPNAQIIHCRLSPATDPLVFRRVSSSTGDFYLCTTETSLGVFSDVMSIANSWNHAREAEMLGDPAHPSIAGPHVWQWPARRDGGIVKSLVWLSTDWVPGGADDYPDSLGGEFNRTTLRPLHGESTEEMSPSRHQPMQQLSADAADYFAKLIGCRLPTPQEWKLAYAASENPLRGANLRDRSWRLELEHMTRTWPRDGNVHRPDAGMFTPAGELPSDEIWHRPNGEEYDDGTLWFREVISTNSDPREFQNLAGNVGEFARDAMGKNYVIGGSALSPPTRPLDKEFELGPGDQHRGFADVGFRLAFSAPPKPLDRLATILPKGDEGFVLNR